MSTLKIHGWAAAFLLVCFFTRTAQSAERRGNDPTGASEPANASTTDSDGDGATDGEEDEAGTDSTSAANFPVTLMFITKGASGHSSPTPNYSNPFLGECSWGPWWTGAGNDWRVVRDASVTPGYLAPILEGIEFPETPPAPNPDQPWLGAQTRPWLSAVDSTSNVNSTAGGISTGLTATRVWIKAPARPIQQKFHFLKVKDTSTDIHATNTNTQAFISAESVDLVIPADQELSDFEDLKPIPTAVSGAVVTAFERLLPMDVAVDADRDGEITFDGKDKTASDRPFRFWINNDQDDVEADEPVLVSENDLLDSTIKTNRDLEDFSRIRISVGIALDQLQEGKFMVGLKFKNSTAAGPNLRIWPNESDTGSMDYPTNGSAADRQRSQTCFGDTLAGTVFIPTSYWVNRSDSEAHLIFEGVKKGEGELALVLKPEGDSPEIESASTHLKLLDVREMYQRARIVNEAEQIPHPWVDDTPPAQTWVWDPWNWQYSEDPDAEDVSATFVHGWRLTYMDYMGWSDTSYKRLWHQGFKGKFYSFRWATFSPSLFTYNDSEYRAWLCGPSLAAFVNQLPNPGRRSLFAHSMGNVITGVALRHGMSVQHYGLCNAAMASMAYDTNPALRIDPDTGESWSQIWGDFGPQKSPDTDPVLAIQDSYGIKNKFNSGNGLRKFNLGLKEDSALGTWVDNNLLFKPDATGHSYYYQEVPQPPNFTYKLFQAPPIGNSREVASQPEAMAYVTKSLTRTAGADLRTRGSIQDSHDMSSWGPGANHSGFGATHSAQWRWNNQSTHLFWEKLFEELELEE